MAYAAHERLLAPSVPAARVREVNDRPVRPKGDYVVYWCIAQRRARFNFGLQRAAELASELDRPLVVLEPLRVGYRWASDRIHAFVLQGMADQVRAYAGSPVIYMPYVEPEPGAGKGLLEAWAAGACAVITDHFPCFFLPRMVAAAGAALSRLEVRLEAVDGNGLMPIPESPRLFTTAHSFRRHLQKTLAPHLFALPLADPIAGRKLREGNGVPSKIARRWKVASGAQLSATPAALAALPIDHEVQPSPVLRGGASSGRARLAALFEDRLARYGTERNQPDADAASGLSPYLHFGHVGAHEVFAGLIEHEEWTPENLSEQKNGSREGWWGASPAAEAFLDELVTWRELGYHFCEARPTDYDRYESLPDFAKTTLAEHASDPRDPVYSLARLAAADTHDDLWNAAQRQLLREGRMHNYLRMLWGKKVLEWTRTPRQAFDFLIELNNRYALDGRNPNSYSGIGWVLGRFDRAWGPERPIFGKVRYMSSDNTKRKLRVRGYLERYGSQASLL